ncbi:hypothetical protein F4680DRAFT_406299 [Xylaria scruposa]|nr:hypothetical protein F4680DRAFT_406299 [Xylaria scruposa]
MSSAASLGLVRYFYAYSRIPMSVWLQTVFAYSVRAFLLWTMLSLLLLASRYIKQSAVSFVTELYAATFHITIGIFGIVYFPVFTIKFLSLCAIAWALEALAQPVTPASPEALPIKIKRPPSPDR